MEQKKTVCIIGGGASGLVAAIAAAESGAEVTVIEHGQRIGRKLLSTGNGKCNLSNTDQSITHYHGDRAFIESIFERVSYGDVISFLTRLGIFTKNRNGYLYPYSEQASSVLDVLRFAVRKCGIEVITDASVKDITKDDASSCFKVRLGKENRQFDSLIIATGGKACPATGSDGSGYKLAERLGHRIIKPLPALVPLKSDAPFCRELKGLRLDALAELYIDDRPAGAEEGEIQFTDYGVSGIPAFQLSHLVSSALDEGRGKIKLKLDLAPFMTEAELLSYLKARRAEDPSKKSEEFLIGFLPKSMGILLNRLCGIRNSSDVRELSVSDLEKLAKSIKGLIYNIIGTGSFDKAQACLGGVETSQLTENLESRLAPGLYFAGEIIDVLGDCGGYNLTWAFATGILSGRSAAGASL